MPSLPQILTQITMETLKSATSQKTEKSKGRIIRVEQRLTDMEARSFKSVSDQRSQVDTLKNDFDKRI